MLSIGHSHVRCSIFTQAFLFWIAPGGQPAAALRLAHAGKENVVALADIDWVRGSDGFERFPKASKYKDFRHVYVEKPLTRTSWEARLLTQAADKYKVATQMGNQGYSHDSIGTFGWAGRRRAPSRRAMPNIAPSWPTATRAAAAPDRRTTSASTCALQMARILRFRQQPDRRLGRAHPGSAELGAATGARAPGQRGNVSRKTRCRRSRSPTTWPSGMSSGRVPGCRR